MAHQFPCQNCGSVLFYEPGTQFLKCTSCGTENQIPTVKTEVIEEDFLNALSSASSLPAESRIHLSLLKCTSCGAESTVPEHTTATKCSFCGTPSVLKNKIEKDLLRPKYLLPFAINKQNGLIALKKWIASLWFAPSALKQLARLDDLNGIYIPYWTYDSLTLTKYTGQRGVYYYVTETYRVNGKTQTRQVRKTRWYPASGSVQFQFDDVLVPASKSLPQNYARALEPWDLKSLTGFQEHYLSGFQSECYQVNLKDGFEIAKPIMEEHIVRLVHRDIGGDTQMISSLNTQYSKMTYKHILLPIWISAFRFNNKVFRVLVNARTGEVQGERPWSWVKIFFAAAGAAILIYAALCWYESIRYGSTSYGGRGFLDLLNIALGI
jgi:LSD1 subclass zinc finger protein